MDPSLTARLPGYKAATHRVTLPKDDDLTELEREYLEDMEALARQNGEEWF